LRHSCRCQRCDAVSRADAGKLVWVRVVITEIGWDGGIRRRALDTSGLTDPGRWEDLLEQVLAFPPPYRAAPDSSIYVIHAGDRAVLVGEQDRTGPLHDLVTTILAAGEPTLAAQGGLWAGGAGNAYRSGFWPGSRARSRRSPSGARDSNSRHLGPQPGARVGEVTAPRRSCTSATLVGPRSARLTARASQPPLPSCSQNRTGPTMGTDSIGLRLGRWAGGG
jgi:hypothetical protein